MRGTAGLSWRRLAVVAHAWLIVLTSCPFTMKPEGSAGLALRARRLEYLWSVISTWRPSRCPEEGEDARDRGG